VVFPVREIRYEILTHFHRQVFARVCVEALSVSYYLLFHHPDWKELALVVSDFRFVATANLCHHPLAVDAVIR
jgi:hypothetical protein